jgi:hypothetical protein
MFELLPRGSKDYLIWAVVIIIGIIFYYIGQQGLAMLFFAVGIVLYLFFSFTEGFHLFRKSGDDDIVDNDDNVDESDDEDDDNNVEDNDNADDDAGVDNNDDKK